MPDRIAAPQVGAPDPELKNSPVFEETDEEIEVFDQEGAEAPVCYFNSVAYQDGDFVCAGSDLLRCGRGSWIRVGSCDPDNP